MTRFALAGFMLGAVMAVPAQALEHQATISHPAAGQISAEYLGSTQIVSTQLGASGPGGRANSLRCAWSVSLSVERRAHAGSALQAIRTMRRDGALRGSLPGWCSSNSKGIERIVAARRGALREAMMAMVAQDRDVILAEAEAAQKRARDG